MLIPRIWFKIRLASLSLVSFRHLSVLRRGRHISYVYIYFIFSWPENLIYIIYHIVSLQLSTGWSFVIWGEIWHFQIPRWRNLAEAPRLIFTKQDHWSVPSSMSWTSCRRKKPSGWKNIHTHTHTHTNIHTHIHIHTNTHTHTHTHTHTSSNLSQQE